MNSKRGQHDQEHQDAIFLYELQALSSNETASVELQIAECADCQREMEAIRRFIGSFVSWPTDVLRPPESLWDRLAQRIARETGTEPVKPPRRQASERVEWEEAAPGISVKILATDEDKRRVTMLVRLAPGTDYPPHRHAGVEELHLLQGELMIDKTKLYAGDYVRADSGSAGTTSSSCSGERPTRRSETGGAGISRCQCGRSERRGCGWPHAAPKDCI